MKKIMLILLIGLAVLVIPCSGVLAKGKTTNSALNVAIKKYKRGNYTGCLQDCQNYIKSHPTNATAYYYMAISYVQAGMKDEAIKAYSKVLALKPNTKLSEYAQTGKRCLETPDQCRLKEAPQVQASELDRFIVSPPSDGLAPAVRRDLNQKRLDAVRNEINKDGEMDEYNFRKFKDYSSENIQEIDKVKIAENKPTDEEIKAALKVLDSAGINPYSQAQGGNNMYQNPELMQLNAMMGNGNQSNNNSMMNMLPMLMMQGQNGASGYSPQLMQAVMMNSMMPDFTYNVDNNK